MTEKIRLISNSKLKNSAFIWQRKIIIFERVLFLNMILDQGEALVVAKARNQQLRILHEKLQQCTTAA